MKILFVHPPWAEVYGSYREASKIGNAFPPLGLCYLSAVAESAGHEARIIDAEMVGKSVEDVVEDARRFGPDVVGITATTSIAHVAANLAGRLKVALPATPIVLGGPHCAAVSDACLAENPAFDYAIYGEAENSLVPFLEMLAGRMAPEAVPGLIFRASDGAIVKNALPPLERDLERLPFPDRSKLELDKYTWSVPGKGIVRFTTIMTSRGCPFRCIFCSAHTVFGRKVRKRPIEGVLDELQQCVERFGIRHFSFIDDTLTLDHDRVRKLCAGILDRRLGITWEGWTRADTVDREILSVMRSAGFTRVSFGIETADPEISKLVKKGVPLDAYQRAYAAAKAAGLETRGSIILGMPDETRETALRTILFASRLRGCDQLYINIATPYPATELFEIARSSAHGMRLLTEDFSQYRRYGSAVVEVNDLSQTDLVELQRLGFLLFYLRPRRIWYNFRRAGFRAFAKNSVAFVKSVIAK